MPGVHSTSWRSNWVDVVCTTNIATLIAINAYVTNGESVRRPPNAVLGATTERAPSLTHSTHWWPTAAERMHSGHT